MDFGGPVTVTLVFVVPVRVKQVVVTLVNARLMAALVLVSNQGVKVEISGPRAAFSPCLTHSTSI